MVLKITADESNNRDEKGTENIDSELSRIWLGRRDSNPRMLGPKPSALPLGDAPIWTVKQSKFYRKPALSTMHRR